MLNNTRYWPRAPSNIAPHAYICIINILSFIKYAQILSKCVLTGCVSKVHREMTRCEGKIGGKQFAVETYLSICGNNGSQNKHDFDNNAF